MKTGTAGRKLIEDFESFVPFVYDDLRPTGGEFGYKEWQGERPKGTLTIGYGHTDAAGLPHIHLGMTVTKDEADEILSADLASVEADVNRFVKVPLTQNQFDALVSFHFNTGALGRSSVIRAINNKQFSEVPADLNMWVRSKGRVLRGLVRRRKAEGDLFMASG